jgi:hypothetical protein
MRASFRSLMVLGLLGTAAAVPAYAQSSSSDAALTTYAACSGKPSQADTDAAHGAYMAGKGSFDEADYATAVNYFKDAYRRDCTKHDLLPIIARAYELQGNRREAIHALETYLDRVPTAPDAEVQKRHIANLKREISEQPTATPSASVVPSASASASPSATASALPIPPVPAASTAPTSEPPAAAPPPSSHSIVPWVVVGVGGAALITGAILYGVGGGKVSSAENDCPAPNHTGLSCTTTDASNGNSGRSLETVGVIAGSVGIAAVAGGLLWHFMEPSSSSRQQTGTPFVTPQVAPGYAGLGVTGRF